MARHLVQRIIVPYLLKTQPQLTRLILPLYEERYSLVNNFASQKRQLHKDLELSDHTCEISNYEEYQSNFKPIIQIVVRTIMEILDLPLTKANKIVIANPQLKKRTRANILSNFYNLLDIGMKKNTIAQNIWLLAHENDKLKNKLDSIAVLNMDCNVLVPWLRLKQDELTNYVFHAQNNMNSYGHNKIEHLANRLECSLHELCELMIRYSFLVKIPIAKIDSKLDILYEYNINNKNILRDMWIFQYSEEYIRYRCDLYRNIESKEMKTWAIKYPLKVISESIRKNQMKRYYSGCHNIITDYLLCKLNVDNDFLQFVLNKWPDILRMDIVQLDKIINLLLNNGLSSGEIVKHGSILCFNINAIERRIESLKEHGFQIKLSSLMMSDKLFKKCIKKYRIEKENVLLKSYDDIEEYLIHKLNSDKATIEKVKKKWPRLTRVNVAKLEKSVNILKQNNFTDKQILHHKQVFRFKSGILENRIEILKKASITPNISTLMLSTKSFNEYVKLYSQIK